MPDKKLTDNDIIEAVKMCSKTKCRDCILCNDPCEIDYGGIEPFLVDLINRLQAENERLENTLDDVLNREPILVERSEKYAKAEAYKEVVEKIKKQAFDGVNCVIHKDVVFVSDIDNTYKELVGE